MNDHFTFEQLPNEIFQELFEYFGIYELYKIFSPLNKRFESLILNFKYLQLILYSPEELNYRMTRYLLPKTQTLIIDHSKKFYEPLEAVSFSHIRRLILCQPTREQWNSIHPLHFPFLERLCLINSRFAYRTEQLCQFIFTGAFHSLYSCSLPHIAYIDHNQWTYSCSLRSLEISIWDIRVYMQILRACPSLLHLKLELSKDNTQENLFEFHSIKTHSTLRYLKFCPFNPITYNLIDFILSFVPNLTYFSLYANHQQPSHISLHTLASVLKCRTLQLNRINIVLTLPDNLCNENKIHTNHSLFQSLQIASKFNQSSKLTITGSL